MMTIRMYSLAGAVRSTVLAVTLICSCVTTKYLPYPTQSQIEKGAALPIDGTWLNRNNVPIRIERGVVYFDDPSINPPYRNGDVLGKNIRQVSARRYVMDATSHNVTEGIVKFGQGEIEVLSAELIILRTFPNDATHLKRTVEALLRRSVIADEALFLSQLGEQPTSSLAQSLPDTKKTASAGLSWAVVIGISKYKDSRIPGLRYGDAVHRLVIEQQICGTNITIIIDNTLSIGSITVDDNTVTKRVANHNFLPYTIYTETTSALPAVIGQIE